MSVSCYKNYTVTILTGKRFTLYWPFEDGASPMVDKFQSVSVILAPGITIAAGLYGSGLEHVNPATATIQTLPLSTMLPAFAYDPTDPDTTGISCSFWVKFVVSHDLQYRFLFEDAVADTWSFYIGWQAGALNTKMYDPIGGSDTLSVAQAFTLGVWHHICVTLETSTNLLTLYADAVPVASHVSTIVLPKCVSGRFVGGTINVGAEDFTVDEFGLSTVNVFAQSNVDWLYNAGAGRTWPAVQYVGG